MISKCPLLPNLCVRLSANDGLILETLSLPIVLHINNFIASKALYYAISALLLSFFITQITLVASFRYFSNAFTTEVLKSSNVGKNLQ
jgi:hypothetical protein